MSLDTYVNIQAEIANVLSRPDLTSEIQTSIRVAESIINKKLSLTSYESSVAITVTAGTNHYALPADYRSVRVLWLDGLIDYPLSYRTPSQFQRENSGSSVSDFPTTYTIKGDDIILNDVVDSEYTVNMDYLGMYAPLSDSNVSNFLTMYSPETIYWGAIAEACTFTKDTEAEAKWGAKFMGSLEMLVPMVEDMRYGGVPLEIRASEW